MSEREGKKRRDKGGSSKKKGKKKNTALTKVIYPSLSTLLKQGDADTETIRTLKNAFDQLEQAEPGISNQLLRNLVEILQRVEEQ